MHRPVGLCIHDATSIYAYTCVSIQSWSIDEFNKQLKERVYVNVEQFRIYIILYIVCAAACLCVFMHLLKRRRIMHFRNKPVYLHNTDNVVKVKEESLSHFLLFVLRKQHTSPFNSF